LTSDRGYGVVKWRMDWPTDPPTQWKFSQWKPPPREKVAEVKKKIGPRKMKRDLVTHETLKDVFCMPLHEAARKLDVSATYLKSRCRALGVLRWPYRQTKSMLRSKRKLEERDEITAGSSGEPSCSSREADIERTVKRNTKTVKEEPSEIEEEPHQTQEELTIVKELDNLVDSPHADIVKSEQVPLSDTVSTGVQHTELSAAAAISTQLSRHRYQQSIKTEDGVTEESHQNELVKPERKGDVVQPTSAGPAFDTDLWDDLCEVGTLFDGTSPGMSGVGSSTPASAAVNFQWDVDFSATAAQPAPSSSFVLNDNSADLISSIYQQGWHLNEEAWIQGQREVQGSGA